MVMLKQTNSSDSLNRTISLFCDLAKAVAPPASITVSEWADKNRILRASGSSEPGQWRTSRFPYMREIMDCLSADSPVQDISLMKGAQISGSESGNNLIGYIIDIEPGPTMMVQPTINLAKRYSKQRISPMIKDSPALRSKVKDARARDSGNTVLSKEFPNGFLIITGANSAADLRSTPVRYLILDEIDAYPDDVEGEGDPVDLAFARTRNFPRRKVFKLSTPKIKGLSRIEAEYLESDQRKFFVPCPECGHMHVLEWANFIIPVDKKGKKRPQDAYMACPSCGSIIHEHHKTWMFERGEWRATAPENLNPRRRGYHISTLYSPIGFFSWGECAEEWIKAQKNPKRLKTFVNTILGETWEELGEGIEAEELLKRREAYNCEVPNDVLVLTCSVDVQDNRLEYDVKGWGIDYERWGIEYGVIMGDPGQIDALPEGQKTVWQMLDDIILHRFFTRSDGQRLQIMTTCIDSGGHHTKAVYKYCKAREFRRVWAIKGQGGSGIPFIQRPKKRNEGGVWLFMIGVDVGKDTLASRLKIAFEGPGYCHYPTDPKRGYDMAYFEGLTAEHRVTRYSRGRPSIHWEKRTSGARNEPFDLENYNTAAIEILNPPFEVLKQQLNGGTKIAENVPNKPKSVTKRTGVVSKGIG
jgi:phage terminase large subunit GpA-like protein